MPVPVPFLRAKRRPIVHVSAPTPCTRHAAHQQWSSKRAAGERFAPAVVQQAGSRRAVRTEPIERRCARSSRREMVALERLTPYGLLG